MNLLDKTKAWNERNKQPWQRKLEARGNQAFDHMDDTFAKNGKLENVGKKFDDVGNKMIRGGVTMAFWPIVAIWKSFKKNRKTGK